MDSKENSPEQGKKDALTNISTEEARQKIMQGEKLENVSLAFLDLSNTEIPGDLTIEASQIAGIDLRGTTVKGNVSFAQSLFLGVVSIGTKDVFDKSSSATFEGRVIFNDTFFHEEAHFGKAVFHQAVAFRKAHFEKMANFHSCEFKQQAYFWAIKFLGVVIFNHCSFEAEAHMSRIHFSQMVKFEGCSFHDEANFEDEQFEGYASFLGVKFHQMALFNRSTFAKSRFEEAEFADQAQFVKTIFQGEADFGKAIFKEKANFDDSYFESKASFKKTSFNEEVSFVYARFFGLASFLQALFEKDISFLNSQFHDEALFNFDRNTLRSLEEEETMAATFKAKVDFTNVRFHRRAVFEKIIFHEEAVFASSYFGEQAAFYGADFSQDAEFSDIFCNQELDFNEAKIGGRVVLDRANINRRFNLIGTEFQKISFFGASIDTLMVEKYQLEERMDHEEKKEYSKAEQEYIILKESFARRGMEDEEDWAYRQKKIMQRKASSLLAKARLKGKKSPEVPNSFRAILILIKNILTNLVIEKGSGYGTQPLRITFLAVFVIFVFASVYACQSSQIIRPDGDIFTSEQAVYFSFITFTTMGFGDIQPLASGYMKYIVASEAFLGIFIMTLFVGTYTRKIIR